MTLRRLIGFALFAAYLWCYWDLYRLHFAWTPDTLNYWLAMAACFILLGIGAWLFDLVWPPKKMRRR